jgi:hypothetical protein
MTIKMDVTKKTYVENGVKAVLDRFGKIDILVNNAGISQRIKFVGIEESDWDQIQNVNLKGVYLVTRAILPHMMKRNYGKIISISSMLGKEAIQTVLWVFAISGFLSIGYQVLLARVLSVFFEDAAYSFTTLVVTFICGLSLGSFLVAKWVDRVRNPLLIFGLVESLIGLSILRLLPVLYRILETVSTLRDSPGATWWGYTSVEFLIAFCAMLIPTLLMGMTLPLVSKIYTLRLENVGSRIGDVSALEPVGSIAGSFAAGFIFIPFIGIESSCNSLSGGNQQKVVLAKWLAKKSDILILDNPTAIHPKLSPNLYTEEFYRMASERLTPRGVIAQWLPTNWMSGQEIKMLMRSFLNVFPYASNGMPTRIILFWSDQKKRFDSISRPFRIG